jgi:hypothetical protein
MDASRSYLNALLQAQLEHEQGAPQHALNVLRLATSQLHADICCINKTIERDTTMMGPRILRRIRTVLTAVESEIENARIQDTMHAYASILTFDIIEADEGNVLESLINNCTVLRGSTNPCHVCIKCFYCGGKGNSHCKFPGTNGTSCGEPTS